MAAVADFNTVALLLADTTMGYSSGTIVSAGDIVEAQGFRYEVAAENATDQHLETAGGVKLYLADDVLYPAAIGCAANAAVDDAPLLNALADIARATGRSISSPQATYRIESDVNFRRVGLEAALATINCHSGAMVLAGGNAASAINRRQHAGRVQRPGSTPASETTPSLRIMGAKGQVVVVDAADFVDVYSDTSTGNSGPDYSSAYSRIELGSVTRFELANNESTTGSSSQWNNETLVFWQRGSIFRSRGTYAHNHWHIFGPTLENCTVDIQAGSNIYLHSVRAENGGTITFAPGTWNCHVDLTWASSPSTWRAEVVSGLTITDLGTGNSVLPAWSKSFSRSLVMSASVHDVVVNTQTRNPSRSPSIGVIRAGNASLIKRSGRIKVYPDDILSFLRFDTGNYRWRIYCYGEDGKPIVPTTGDFSSATFSVVASSYLSSTVNVAGGRVAITAGAIREIEIEIRGPTATLTQGTARGISCFLYRHMKNASHAARGAEHYYGIENRSGDHPVSGIPTQGWAPLGYTFTKSDGTALYVVTFSLETALAGDAGGSDTAIAVSSGAGAQNGDIIGVLNDDAYVTDWRTIASGGGTSSVTLSSGLTGACGLGNRVCIMRVREVPLPETTAGFTAIAGTATKGALSTYDAAGAAGAVYNQAEVQAIATALQAMSERLKAYDDALFAARIIST